MDTSGSRLLDGFEQSFRPKSCPPLHTNHEPDASSSSGMRRWSQHHLREDTPLLEKSSQENNADDNEDEDVVVVVVVENLIRNKKELLTMISLMLALFSALCSYAMVAPILPLEVRLTS